MRIGVFGAGAVGGHVGAAGARDQHVVGAGDSKIDPAGGDHLLLDHFAQVRAVRQRIGIGRGQGLHAHRIRKAGAILRE